MQLLKELWKDEEGISAIEYGVTAGLIAIALVAALSAFGFNLQAAIGRLTGLINNVERD